jgi:hypothetical protein
MGVDNSDYGILGTLTNHALGFRTNNYEHIRITSGGNVGIGTTSPAYKLDVSGTIRGGTSYRTSIGGDASGAAIYFGSAGDIDSLGVIGTYASLFNISSGNGDISFQFNATEKMRITTGGNVGIGTTSPNYKLDVNGSINIYSGNSLRWGSGDAEIINSGWNLLFNTYTGSALTEKMRVTSAGNVGIGTTSPAYKLDVSGDIRATGEVIAYSDARVKENVETIPNALEKVTAMRGVNYNKIGEQKRSTGVIAQELLEILPEAVHQDEEGMYSVAYGNIVGVLIEAIKEQQKQIDELKKMLG